MSPFFRRGFGVALVCAISVWAIGASAVCADVSPARERAIVLVKNAEGAYLQGDYNRAAWLREVALKSDATYPRAYTWLGAVREKQGRLPEARAIYTRLLSLAPQSVDAQRARARIAALKPRVVPAPRVEPAATPQVAAARVVRVSLEGREIEGLATTSGRVLVPLRPLFEGLGATVQFDPANGGIKADSQGVRVQLQVGSEAATVNGERVTLDEPARAVNGQTMVPLRFVSEAFGARVSIPAPDRVLIVRNPAPRPTIGPLEPRDWPSPSPTPMAAPTLAPTGVPGQPAREPSATPTKSPRAPLPESVRDIDDGAEDAPRLVSGRWRSATQVRVGKQVYNGAFLLSGEDHDMTFDLGGRWDAFEVRVAVPDNARNNFAELRGWFEDVSGGARRPAFRAVRVYKGRAPVSLRVVLWNVQRLTIAPGYPGNAVALLSPRFVRER